MLEWRSDRIGDMDILLAEKWVHQVTEVVRVYDRLLKLRPVLQNSTVTIICAHVLQMGLKDEQRGPFL